MLYVILSQTSGKIILVIMSVPNGYQLFRRIYVGCLKFIVIMPDGVRYDLPNLNKWQKSENKVKLNSIFDIIFLSYYCT